MFDTLEQELANESLQAKSGHACSFLFGFVVAFVLQR